MQEKCNKCNSTNLFVEIQGTRKGLYCGKCGKWQNRKDYLQINMECMIFYKNY